MYFMLCLLQLAGRVTAERAKLEQQIEDYGGEVRDLRRRLVEQEESWKEKLDAIMTRRSKRTKRMWELVRQAQEMRHQAAKKARQAARAAGHPTTASESDEEWITPPGSPEPAMIDTVEKNLLEMERAMLSGDNVAAENAILRSRCTQLELQYGMQVRIENEKYAASSVGMM